MGFVVLIELKRQFFLVFDFSQRGQLLLKLLLFGLLLLHLKLSFEAN